MSAAAFVAVLAANRAAAQAAAQEAKVERCTVELQEYNSQTATVQQMQSYADCVETVYPAAMSGPETLLVKAAIVLALIGAGIGGWDGWKLGGPLMGILESFALGLLLPIGAGILGELAYGLYRTITS